jgi:hypothetical protein
MVTTNALAALDALSNRPQRKRRSKSLQKNLIYAEDGPFDRRFTTNRRISITALVPPEVDVLALRQTMSGIVLSTDVASGVIVPVRQVGQRREVWLRGKVIRMFLPASLMPQRSRHNRQRSVALDVYKRVLPNRGLELEMVPRGSRRSPW